MGRQALCKFQCCDTQAPYVCTLVIAVWLDGVCGEPISDMHLFKNQSFKQSPHILFAADDLGCHPTDAACKCVAHRPCLAPRTCSLCRRCNAKVSEPHCAILAHQNVASLDVTVDDIVLVQVIKALECFIQDGAAGCFAEALGVFVLHDVMQRATRHIGHDHPQVLLVHKRTIQRQQIGVVELRHGLRLAHKRFL